MKKRNSTVVYANNFSLRFFFLILILVSSSYLPVYATTHHVGQSNTYPTLNHALRVTAPGDTVMIHKGTYQGDISLVNLQGRAGEWIYIISAAEEKVIFKGGATAWQLTDAAYLHIKGIIFQQQTNNGLNIDDGGTYSTPSHHIIFDSCIFQNINGTGNNDLLKMSGVDFFEIKNCFFLDGSPGGSGIDMVGCHEGVIKGNKFQNQGSNSIQAKGGSKNISIEHNFFKNGGQRSVNLGGSTGLKFFRPLDAPYEAAYLKVYSNIFVGSDAPIAFVGCIGTDVTNNTIYLPEKWVIRILQETIDTSRFYPCGDNSFKNNIVYHDGKVSIDCNVGANTNPQSFIFSGNLWYHSQNPSWRGPVLPVQENDSIVGEDPGFTNPSANDFTLKLSSIAKGKGFLTQKNE